MQATITYCLTEAAQRAQMAATGQPIARKHTTLEDVPPEVLMSPYCAISEDGCLTLDLTRTICLNEQGEISPGSTWSWLVPELGKQPESGLAAWRALSAALAAKSVYLRESYAKRRVCGST
jgi:hypothetical protein